MTLFLQLNFLLAVSAVLFVSQEKVTNFFGVRVSFQKTLRSAQVIIVITLLLPMILRVLPSKSLKGVPSKIVSSYEEGLSRPLPLEKEPKQVKVFLPQEQGPVHSRTSIDFSVLLVGVWILGVMFFLCRFSRNYLKIKRILRTSAVIKKHRKINIVTSEQVFVPFSVQVLHTRWVVIPNLLLTEKTNLELAIKHELQHHRQGDTTWAVLIEFAGCFFYFNPAFYLWKNIITELQELACDESLIGQGEVSSRAYGSCLLRVAEAALNHRHMYEGTTSMAAVIKDSNYFRKFLLRRIEMITEKRSPSRPWTTALISTLVLVASAAAAIGSEKLARGAKPVNPGTLKVDPEVQKITDDVLTRALLRTKATAGFIIVAEPSTGKILAVANKDLKANRKGHWALNELMETGSIAKPLMVAEAIELEKTDLQMKHNCENGRYNYAGTTYRDWKEEGWSELSTTEAIELSSNICSIKIAELVGEKNLIRMLDRYGFGPGGIANSFPGARTGERPEESSQILPQTATGLGFRSSALEILQAYGAFANGGNLMEPISPSETPRVRRKVLSSKTVSQINQLLQNVVHRGTGKKAQSDLYTTAGKTSSLLNASFLEAGYKTKNQANHAGFIGFAPVSKPVIEVYVGIINPNTDDTGAHGGFHAAPVFKEVVENVLTHLKVTPDKI